MAGEITINQMLQSPTIKRVVQQIKTPINAFQQHFKMGLGSTASETSPTNVISWDFWNPTRTIAKVRPRGSGPASSSEKNFGGNTATLVRTHEKIHLEQDKIFNLRDLGKGFDSPLDQNGAKYIERQLGFLKQKFTNAREFMVSRMFRNGFGFRMSGDDITFVESGAANAMFSVDYKIPANQLGTNVTLGSATNIFQNPWDNPATDINAQLLALRKNMIRVNGMAPSEVWINSTTLGHLQRNNVLAQLAGSANMVVESMTGANMKAEEADAAVGYMVRFRGLPKWTFIVYDGVLNVDLETDSQTEADSSMFIPDGYALITPEPDSNWLGSAAGSEIVAESYVDPGKVVTGLHFWKNRTILPPGWDLIGVDNFLPILYVPSAVVWAKVYDPNVEVES